MHNEIILDNEQRKNIFDDINVSNDSPRDDVVKKEKIHYDTSLKPEYHEIANREPMMSQKELEGLVEDMSIHGFRPNRPVLMYEGLILDGRNRTVAAKYAGVDVVTVEFTGTYQEAEAESLRLNNRRRHKSAGQKAMAAAYALKANKARRDEIKQDILNKNSSIGKNKLAVEIGQKCPILTGKAVEKQQGCSNGNRKNAVKLLDNDTVLAQSVFDGELSLTAALQKYQEILELRTSKSKYNDGDFTPEELERNERINQAKQDPEGAVAKLEVKEIQLSKLRDEVKKLKQEVSSKDEFINDLATNNESIQLELSFFKNIYIENREVLNIEEIHCNPKD